MGSLQTILSVLCTIKVTALDMRNYVMCFFIVAISIKMRHEIMRDGSHLLFMTVHLSVPGSDVMLNYPFFPAPAVLKNKLYCVVCIMLYCQTSNLQQFCLLNYTPWFFNCLRRLKFTFIKIFILISNIRIL
jgi:hypothetical protein